MSVISFIGNNWDSIITVGGLVGGYLGLKKKKATEVDRWELISKLAKQALPKLLKDSRVTDDAHVRRVIAGAIWSGLDRLGIKRSTALAKLVDEAVEHAIGELAEEIWRRGFSMIETTLEATNSTLKGAT
jgi:hypothetical protein